MPVALITSWGASPGATVLVCVPETLPCLSKVYLPTAATGTNTAQLFERILNAKPHPEMGYRSCLGIIRLVQQYSAQRMEAAAERALLAKACRYQSLKSILKNSLDKLPLSPPQPGSPPLTHDNVRDAEYFDQRETDLMLNQPMMEKLLAMRLQGMVEALKTQESRSGDQRTEFFRTALSAGRSTMDLAREPGTGAKTESGQTERTGLHGGHRLSSRTWPGQDGGARSGQRLSPGPQSREHLRDWTLRRGQDAFSHWLWHRKPVTTGTRLSICGLQPCFENWLWPERMAACATSWHD